MAAKLVARPADKRFQYGYWHVEPMVLSVNALMMCLICLYAFINGVAGLRQGGHVVDSFRVIGFSIVTALLCGGIGLYERIIARKINSQILKNDSREWLIDFSFSMVTLVGFTSLFLLPESLNNKLSYHIDSAMVTIMAVILIPFPVRVLWVNLREVLRITGTEEVLVGHVDTVLQTIKAEYPIISYSNHILKVGRTYFVEVNILVGENFPLHSIVEQDVLRDRIWKACDKPLEDIWLSVCITADQRWS
jgi:predicted Co/Zn/Cd cation transporter (cation efflux family)